MEWLKSKKWLVCLLCALFVITPVANTGWAQPDDEEEEEEPVQTRPNPMDKTTFQNRPSPADKTTLNTRTGISVQSGAPVNWDPFDKNPSSHGKQLVPGQALKGNMPTSGKSGLLKPGGASPGSLVGKELGDDIVDPGKKTGATMMGGTSGVNPGGAVGKELGDDVVDPVKKTGKSMMGGKIIK